MTQKNRDQTSESKAASVPVKQRVSESEALLTGVAEAARRLLAIADFDAAVEGALEAIAIAANINRIFILKHHTEPATPPFATCPYEWTSIGIPLSKEAPDRFPMVYSETEGFSEWLDKLKAGCCVQKRKAEMSADGQAIQEIDQALSVLTVPIFVEGKYWGNFGFDDCTIERVWSEAEIAVLETAAATFAAALQRRESVATLQSRDQLLDSVNAAAQCLVASENLAVAVPLALRILGEGTKQDRVYVFENVYPKGPTEVFWNVPYEWTARSIPLGSDIAIDEMPVAMSSFPSEIVNPFLDGQTIQFLTQDLMGVAKKINEEMRTLSILAVPIYVQGKWWGVLGFDDCTAERVWSEAEIAVLETAAACVGSAVERDHVRKEREVAAQAWATELEAHNRALAERDRILEATAAAANVMLTENNFDSAVNQALKIVGEGLEVDRVGLMAYFETIDAEPNYHQQMYEWVAEGFPLQIEHPELVKISDEGMECALEQLLKGEVFGGIVEDFPEPFRSGQQEIKAQSVYGIPISVNNRYWGIVALDDCKHKTRRSEAELEALMTLANCIGSAIEQERNRKAREAAERSALIMRERAARAAELEAANKVLKVRDRWLQTTATAASELLSATDITASVQNVLATIGENLECDRLTVMKHIPDHKSHPLGAVRMLYEWDAKGIQSQIADPKLNVISVEGLEDWFNQFLLGKCVGGNVSDLPEPARSEQASLGALSTYGVPVFIDDSFWGLIGMDYCREEKQLGKPELAVFKTAATCIGSAIYQAQARRDKAARERAKLLGRVAEAANLLLRSANFIEVLPEVTQLLGEAVGSDRCGVVTTHDSPLLPSSSIYLIAEWQKNNISSAHKATPGLERMAWHQFSKLYECLIKEEPANYLVSELSEQGRKIFEAQGVSSVAFIPIVVNGTPWGQIGFDNCGEPRLYDDAEIAILKVAAESIAAAVARQAQDAALRESEKTVLAEREKAAQAQVAQLSRSNQALKRSLDSLAQQPELEAFLQGVVNEVVAQTGANSGQLFLYDSDARTCSLEVSTDNSGDWRSVADMDLWLQPVPVDEAPGFWARMFGREAFVVEDLPTALKPGPHIWEPSIAWHLQRGHTSFICAPLLLGEQAIGFLGLPFVGETKITQEAVELAQALTNQATLAIHLTQLANQAKSSAIIEERNRLAREIHDTLAQAFTGVSLQLEAAKDSFTDSPDDALYHVGQAGSLARRGLSEARRSVRALRSQALTTDTLPNALRTALSEMTQASVTAAHVRTVGTPYALPEDIQTNLLRIGQEAATNALRHAKAKRIDLTLTYVPDQIRMTIADDGIGCDVSLDEVEGFGLLGMRERVLRFDGRFSFVSTLGKGTVVDISIPNEHSAPPLF